MTTTQYPAARLWLRSHAANESRLARLLRGFFAARRQEILDRIAQGDTAPALLIDTTQWTDRIVSIVSPELVRFAFSAAGIELGGPAAISGMTLPIGVQVGIRLALTEAMQQPYWSHVAETTRDSLATGLQSAIDSGGGLRAMTDAVQDAMGPTVSRRRAAMIATTETTAAQNQGRHSARQDLAQSGIISSVEWLAIVGDDRTRPTHAALDETRQPALNPQFSVGGHLAPFPGHWSLPAHERVNCRCTTIVATTFAD